MVEGNSVGFKILGLRGLSSGVQDSGTSVIRVEPKTIKQFSQEALLAAWSDTSRLSVPWLSLPRKTRG